MDNFTYYVAIRSDSLIQRTLSFRACIGRMGSVCALPLDVAKLLARDRRWLGIRIFSLCSLSNTYPSRLFADISCSADGVGRAAPDRGSVNPARFVAALGTLLIIQFLLFAEAVATVALVGAIAFGLALEFADEKVRRDLWSLTWLAGVAYVLAAILLSPYLYYMFAFGHPTGVVLNPAYHGADLLSFLIPTAVNELGRPAFFGAVSHTYRATLAETGSYLALPLIVIAFLFGRAKCRGGGGRILIDLLLAICILSLGTRFQFAGYPTLAAPWALVAHLPLIDKALPVRVMVYAFLVLAIIVAIWLSSLEVGKSCRWVLGLALVPFMLPNLSARYWKTPLDTPPFFSTGMYRRYLTPGENVMVIPIMIWGDSMQWQVATGMYFRLAGGYIGGAPLAPPEYARWPIMAALYDVAGVPDAGEQLKALLAHEQVAAVIVSPLKYRFTERYEGHWTAATWLHTALTESERAGLRGLLSSLGVQPLEVGGVTLYRISPARLAPYLHVTALEMQQRYVRARFETLLRATQAYLANGGDLETLESHKQRVLRLAPLDWYGGPAFPTLNPNRIFQVQWALGQWHPGRVSIGVEGSYAALKPLIEEYGPDAKGIYFPFPKPLAALSPPQQANDAGEPALMVMEFTRAGLASAAARVASPSVPP